VTAIRRAFWESDGYVPDVAAPLPSAATVRRLMMEYFQVRESVVTGLSADSPPSIPYLIC
jgi:hypothetical protein